MIGLDATDGWPSARGYSSRLRLHNATKSSAIESSFRSLNYNAIQGKLVYRDWLATR
jgi:hypothetical protein